VEVDSAPFDQTREHRGSGSRARRDPRIPSRNDAPLADSVMKRRLLLFAGTEHLAAPWPDALERRAAGASRQHARFPRQRSFPLPAQPTARSTPPLQWRLCSGLARGRPGEFTAMAQRTPPAAERQEPSRTPTIAQLRISDPEAGPYGIVMVSDGALWVTLVHAGRLLRVGRDGAVDVHELDAPGCRPSLITRGPTEPRGSRGQATDKPVVSSRVGQPSPFRCRRRRAIRSGSRQGLTAPCGAPRCPPTDSPGSLPAELAHASRGRCDAK
jgi:hypothetical protein